MKKYNSVLAFGDSHVAGCELTNGQELSQYLNGDITIEQADAPGKKLAFPQLVAQELGVPCYNFAITGGSNDRSIRLLAKALQVHSNSLILFGYTCTDRKEFYYPDNGNYLGRDKDKFIQVGMQWQGMIDSVVKNSTMTHPINDMFVEKILRPYNNLKELMFYVDAICTIYALDFVHLPLFPENYLAVNKLFDFEGYGCYTKWCEANQFKQLPFLHYDQDAHKALAKLIVKGLL